MQPPAAALPHVMIHGTFDVANYGDLLFPHLLSFGLHPVPHRLTAVSPRGGAPAWADTVAPVSTEAARGLRAALHVVGGGNIIHADGTPLSEYRDIPGGAEGAYAALWRDVAAQAERDGARLAWNAPGVPRALAGVAGVAAALARCDLLTVRDEGSAAHLGAGAAAMVVPDTALDVGRMWPAGTLAAAAEAAFARHGLARPRRWVALHANTRYVEDDAAAMAARLAAIARALDAVPVLLALGPCQGDDALAREIGAHLPAGSLVLDRPAGVREVAGLIAHAEAYAGSSLHGLITALSYGRPGLVVARGPLEKFAGFLAHIGMPERHLQGWSAAVEAAPALLRPLGAPDLAGIARAQDRIAVHWHRMRGLLEAGPRVAPAPRPAVCPICGGTSFRQIATLPDRVGAGAICAGCGASARHRGLRMVLEALRSPEWKSRSCLRLGETGRIAAAGWFATCADAVMPGASHDVILAVDALEGVADPSRALADWRGVLRPGGVMLLSMRTVPGRATTLDWGFPRGDRQGEYRAFGADVAAVLPGLLPGAVVMVVRSADPASGTPSVAFAVAETAEVLAPLRAAGLAA
jgi:hypothetical protein